MKFIKEGSIKGAFVTAGTLKVSGICDEKLELHTLDNAVLLLKGWMTAPELLTAAHELAKFAAGLYSHLAQVCGPCEDCDKDSCPYNDFEEESVQVNEYLREAAGIPDGAKLCAEVDEEAHTVTVLAAEHRYDLRDLPAELLATFAEAGSCLGKLEEHLIAEDIVYGKPGTHTRRWNCSVRSTALATGRNRTSTVRCW